MMSPLAMFTTILLALLNLIWSLVTKVATSLFALLTFSPLAKCLFTLLGLSLTTLYLGFGVDPEDFYKINFEEKEGFELYFELELGDSSWVKVFNMITYLECVAIVVHAIHFTLPFGVNVYIATTQFAMEKYIAINAMINNAYIATTAMMNSISSRLHTVLLTSSSQLLQAHDAYLTQRHLRWQNMPGTFPTEEVIQSHKTPTPHINKSNVTRKVNTDPAVRKQYPLLPLRQSVNPTPQPPTKRCVHARRLGHEKVRRRQPTPDDILRESMALYRDRCRLHSEQLDIEARARHQPPVRRPPPTFEEAFRPQQQPTLPRLQTSGMHPLLPPPKPLESPRRGSGPLQEPELVFAHQQACNIPLPGSAKPISVQPPPAPTAPPAAPLPVVATFDVDDDNDICSRRKRQMLSRKAQPDPLPAPSPVQTFVQGGQPVEDEAMEDAEDLVDYDDLMDWEPTLVAPSMPGFGSGSAPPEDPSWIAEAYIAGDLSMMPSEEEFAAAAAAAQQ